MDGITELASQQLERVKVLATQTGFKYVDLPPAVLGVGIAIGFTDTKYVLASVMAGGSEDQVMLTSGVLHGINQDRLEALTAANYFTSQNPAVPVFLHDANSGWALLMQVSFPIDLLLDLPPFFGTLVRTLPGTTEAYRETIAERWNLGGRPWQWTPEDHNELLLRSMM